MKGMTDTQPTITVLPERHYVAIPASVTMASLGEIVPPLNGEVFRWLAELGAPDTLVTATVVLLDWAAAEGLKWDVSQSSDGEVWGCRLENYLTDPAVEPDYAKWVTELAYRLAD